MTRQPEIKVDPALPPGVMELRYGDRVVGRIKHLATAPTHRIFALREVAEYKPARDPQGNRIKVRVTHWRVKCRCPWAGRGDTQGEALEAFKRHTEREL